MSEKRFKKMDTIIDPFPIWDTVEEKGYNCTDTLDLLVDLLNEQQNIINEQNELIKLIADACTYSKEYSVKEILRKEIKGIDTVAYEFATAWHDYVILSKFFKEHYKEDWDNE